MAQIAKAVAFGQRCMVLNEATSFPATEFQRFIAYARACASGVAGEGSSFSNQIEHIIEWTAHDRVIAEGVVGVLQALKAAIESGLLDGYRKLVRGELFSDYLDMAEYLLDEGYKDAAAVIIGSSLEIHLRALCDGRGIPRIVERNGREVPEKADSLNAKLRGSGCYHPATMKSVTAWLGLRNNAAHGEYGTYTDDAVRAMLIGVRGFISNHPA